MPCGGIYPTSYMPGYNAADHPCFLCGAQGCELWVEEWDAPLHRACVGPFLRTPEGHVVLNHEHEVILDEGGEDLRESFQSAIPPQV